MAGTNIPQAYGGFGAAFMDLVILSQEMGKALCPGPFFSTIIQCAFDPARRRDKDKKKELVERIAGGDLIMSPWPNMKKKAAVICSSGVQMRAEAEGGHYLLNGTKLFVMDGGESCEKLIVVARADDGGPDPVHGGGQ